MGPMGSATVQGHLWGAAAHDWAELQEPTATPLWEAMLAAAHVGHGTRLLDAGCGAGGASVLAARRGAQVNGLDAAAALLAIARRRVPDGDFRAGDLEALPYADGVFDAVIATDVAPYLAHPLAALRELRRVCAPAGCVAIAVWDVPQGCAQRAITGAVCDLLPAPLLSADPFALSAPGALEALVVRAGLTVMGGGVVACPYEYPDGETAWQALASSGLMQAVLRVVGATLLKAAIRGAIAPYETGSGRVRLEHHFRYVTSRLGRDHDAVTARPAESSSSKGAERM